MFTQTVNPESLLLRGATLSDVIAVLTSLSIPSAVESTSSDPDAATVPPKGGAK